MSETPLDDHARHELAANIDDWLVRARAELPAIVAVDRADPVDVGPSEHRWYVRLAGEDKDFTTIWLTLGQRTLKYETYVMAWPEENTEMLFENLLRRNERLTGCQFSIGIEDAVFLRGSVAVEGLSPAMLDQIIGTLYVTVEQAFRSLLRIGFASRFRL